MTIEIAGMICTAIVATIGFILAYKKEERKGRRIALAIGFIFTIISGWLGVEGYFRHKSIDIDADKLQHDWLVLKDSPVTRIEFEVTSRDGMLIPSLIHYARSIQVEIPKVFLGPSLQASPDSPIFFSKVFTDENVAERGRLGVASIKMSTEENGDRRTIKTIHKMDCTASHFITNTILSQQKAGQSVDYCSVSVDIDPLGDTFRLGTIASWPRISMVLVAPKGSKCIGLCQKPLLVSIRLVLRDGYSVEISPSILRQWPSPMSKEELTFELSGDTLLELAKSNFLKSFGYSDTESFLITKGAIAELYRWGTKKSSLGTIVDTVWTTDSSPDDAKLREAISPEYRESTRILRAKESCGFGEAGFCWYRFIFLKEMS